jgi:hypothetical protein
LLDHDPATLTEYCIKVPSAFIVIDSGRRAGFPLFLDKPEFSRICIFKKNLVVSSGSVFDKKGENQSCRDRTQFLIDIKLKLKN